MELLRTGHNLYAKLEEFIRTSSSLVIFVPYIKLNALQGLLKEIEICKTIVVRWEPQDLLWGVSDPEVYELCKSKGIKLFRNPRLHMKAYIDSNKNCLLGSANISSRALNHPATNTYNYEIATIIDSLSFDDLLYFESILCESLLITDSIYEQIKLQLPEKKLEFPNESDFKIEVKAPDKDFLISSLPMSSSVKTLTRIYYEKNGIHSEEINCALHDLALYNIPLDLGKDEFLTRLTDAFMSHPFIKAFIQKLQFNGGEIYFGEAKAWIHSNCADVPTPRRWEITENLQILYKWLIELGDGIFVVDRPNHSERLQIKNEG